MADYWDIVKRVINESDIVLEILDARFPEDTRNRSIEKFATEHGKPLIFVLNKADLVDLDVLEKKTSYMEPKVFLSAIKNLGSTRLRILIRKIVRMLDKKANRNIRLGIVGYPNTGKSSVINVLKQKKSARTSPVPGFTRGKQLIKIENKLYVWDTPGVIPLSQKSEEKKALLSVKSAHNIDNPESVAFEILKKFKEKAPLAFETYYGIEILDDLELTLENLARKQGKLKRGGVPNTKEVAIKLIEDWQRGKILLE